MAKEIEVKFEVQDFESVRRALRKLGGRCGWGGREESTIFDTTRRALKSRGEALRIKTEDGRNALLTFKGPKTKKGKFKVREEIETSLESSAAGEMILKRLGFEEQLRYTKRREHWELGKSSVELDTLLGHRFVEIEGTKQSIKEIARLLHLDWARSSIESYYPDVLRRLQKK